jgi:hypothetical protein
VKGFRSKFEVSLKRRKFQHWAAAAVSLVTAYLTEFGLA